MKMLSGLLVRFAMATKNTYVQLFLVHLQVLSISHNYQAMYYPDGSYAGINEIVFNFQPWLDWYLKETGQRLVGGSGPFAPAAGGHGDADATSGASDSADGGADATSGASN